MPAKYKIISLGEFVALLDAYKGAAVLFTFMSRTQPEMKKTGNRFFGQVWKKSYVSATLNFNYRAARLRAEARRIARENGQNWQTVLREIGNAESYVFQTSDIAGQTNARHPRKWGKRLKGLPLVYHTREGGPRLYVEVMVNRAVRKPGYEWLDGTPLTEADTREISQWIRTRDELVTFRDYEITHVTHVHIDKQRFEIRPRAGELEFIVRRFATAA